MPSLKEIKAHSNFIDFLKGPATELETHARQALREILLEIQSPADFESVWFEVSGSGPYRKLLNHWENWNRRQRENGWEGLARVVERTAYATWPYCLKCGTCCRKGSPSLYLEDLPLVLRGVIKRTDLMTLRKGEIGFSNEQNELIQISREQVKIREKPGTRECLFFQGESGACGIYENRPLQCRVLECWNPEEFQRVKYGRPLNRLDLFDPLDPVLPVIKAHEEKCDLMHLEKGLQRAGDQQKEGQDRVMEGLGFDRHTREFLGETYGFKPEHLGFLLGRPLTEVVASLGYRLRLDPEGRLKVLAKDTESGPRGA
ncbi:MAG TPA: YkgJ family cysteine cluster protein [Thermodesulfobacteriota bacterium]|nr:YkgJ family cysteine cluster protein [Thermodesulfobacteriota bacterium]